MQVHLVLSVLSCSFLLSTGTPLWSSSCSPTPSWVLLCLKPWVCSAWWLHSLFCLLCKALRLWEDLPHRQQHTAVRDAFLNGAMIPANVARFFSFLLAFLCRLQAHQCMDLWENLINVIIVLPYCIFYHVSLTHLSLITELKRNSIHFACLVISYIIVGVYDCFWPDVGVLPS